MPRSNDIQTQRVAFIRDFQRFYVSRMGFLNRQWTSLLSLTEARVMHEIYAGEPITATTVARQACIDVGYLSRLLQKFETAGYIMRRRVVHDKRQRVLTMTPKGKKLFETWSKMTQENVLSVLRLMTDAEQVKMVEAMALVRDLIITADTRAEKQRR